MAVAEKVAKMVEAMAAVVVLEGGPEVIEELVGAVDRELEEGAPVVMEVAMEVEEEMEDWDLMVGAEEEEEVAKKVAVMEVPH
eukprot:gene7316-8710_t